MHITPCKVCGKMHGYLIEKYNGLVPIYCKCDLRDKEKTLANPCAIFCENCNNGPRPIWKPISDYKDENGVRWHVPYFAGPSSW